MFFYAPISLMLCFNLAMFVRTVYMLKKNNALSRRAGISRSTIRRKTVKAPCVKGVSEFYLGTRKLRVIYFSTGDGAKTYQNMAG